MSRRYSSFGILPKFEIRRGLTIGDTGEHDAYGGRWGGAHNKNRILTLAGPCVPIP